MVLATRGGKKTFEKQPEAFGFMKPREHNRTIIESVKRTWNIVPGLCDFGDQGRKKTSTTQYTFLIPRRPENTAEPSQRWRRSSEHNPFLM
jgi:hypothetical protein